MRRETKLTNSLQVQVIGVGGGGNNAVNHMISRGLPGIQFTSIDTDLQTLTKAIAPTRIQIGKQLTNGLGTGGRLTIGRRAAFEANQKIKHVLKGTDILYLVTSLGGGTGGGASPVIAHIARESGTFTVAVVTRPFRFEGSEPNQIAQDSILDLAQHVDSLIVFPTDRLKNLSNKQVPFKESFLIADKMISRGVKVINEFVNSPGLINLDFANLKSIMANKGATLITVGQARGIDRARIAAQRALVCPILDLRIHGARAMLVNITAGSNLDLHETQIITNLLKSTTHLGANFILGTIIDENMKDEIRVSVIATGFCNGVWDICTDSDQSQRNKQPPSAILREPVLNKPKPTSEKKTHLSFSLRNLPIPDFLQIGSPRTP